MESVCAASCNRFSVPFYSRGVANKAAVLALAMAVEGEDCFFPFRICGPNSINQPMVADGTTSVKGIISSMKLTYFKLGDTVSYMAMMNTV